MGKLQKNKLHYGWVIAGALFCIQGAIVGILVNCRGMFYSPICSELGFELGDFTLYTAFYGIAGVLAVPVAAKVIPRCNLPLTLCGCAVLISASEFAQSYFNALWQWYAVAVLQGVLQAFLFAITVGVLVNNWFHRKKGLVLGIVNTASGVVGAVLNIVCDRVINLQGWQAAYRLVGVIMLVMMVPASLLLL